MGCAALSFLSLLIGFLAGLALALLLRGRQK